MTWVSKEEQAKAKQYDLLSYMQQAELENLVKVSAAEYATKEHSSLKISNGMWHWWSQNVAGRTAVDYLIKVKGYRFPDAVKEVNRAMEGIEPSFSLQGNHEANAGAGVENAGSEVSGNVNRNNQNGRRNSEIDVLKIPQRDKDNYEAVRYLTGRGIDIDIINEQLERGAIYQSEPYRNVNFVGFGDDGEPKHISYRSTKVSKIRGDSKGSSKEYCFRMECSGSESVHVFESAIDLLSFATMSCMEGKDYRATNLISLSGTTGIALDSFLKKNPNIKNVILHLDNDDAGRKAAVKITGQLRDRYNVFNRPPDIGKDYNDFLCHSLGVNEEQITYTAEDPAGKGVNVKEKNDEHATLEVMYIEPGREPRMVTIDDTLEAMQELVGGRIEEYMPYEDEVGLIVNEEGKLINLEPNRAIRDGDGRIADIIHGPFFIAFAPIESEKFLPLPEELKAKYHQKFKVPERFSRENGRITVTLMRKNACEMER